MQNELRDFLQKVDEVYGLYLDATTAFEKWYEQIVSAQKEVGGRINKSVEELDKLEFWYGKDDEARDSGQWDHACTQKQVKDRNKKAGANHKSMANMSLVLIFQYWEYYRGKIKNRTKKKLMSDLMGDITQLRHSILKNREIGLPRLKKCKEIKWFKEGSKIEMTESQFRELVERIKKEILKLDLDI